MQKLDTRKSKNREVKFIRNSQACAENDNGKEKCGDLAAIFLLFGY